MSRIVPERLTRGPVAGRLASAALLLVGVAGGLVGGSSTRLTGMAVAGSIAAGGLLLLAVARYESVVALGFLLFGVLLVQPALPDLVFGIVILVAMLTGGARWTLRCAPPLVVYILGWFIVLNVLAAARAQSLGQAALFMTITAYLAIFGLWLTGYVNSAARARTVVEPLIVGATVTAALAVTALFVSFPGSNTLTWSNRADGFFADPNVFGPFVILPFALALAELVEPRLLAWRRRWLLVVLLVCGAGILFSYSRGAWLNVILVMTTMVGIYAVRRQSARQAVATVGLGVVAAAVLVPVVFLTGSTSFLRNRTHIQAYDTARFHGQDASFELARTHVLGIGPGQYADVVGIGAHSTYLRALGEEGVLGLALVVLLLFVTLVLAGGNVVRGRTTFGISAVPLLGLWVGLIANSFFIDTLHWRHLWLVAGLIWVGSSATPRQGGEDHAALVLSPASVTEATATETRSAQPLSHDRDASGRSHAP